MIIEEQRGKKCPKQYYLRDPSGLVHTISVGDLPCEDCDHFKFRTTNRVNRDKNGNTYYDKMGKPIMGSDEFCELLLDEEAEDR